MSKNDHDGQKEESRNLEDPDDLEDKKADLSIQPVEDHVSRRTLLLSGIAGSLASVLPLQGAFAKEAVNEIPRRSLGKTGEKVSIVGIGGYHLGIPDEATAIRIVQTALDSGVNFLDNCWDYNGGVSEERMGKALRDGYRQKAFLMTKKIGRA